MCLTNDNVTKRMLFENYEIRINLVFHKKPNLWAPFAHFKQDFQRGQIFSLIDMNFEIKETLLSMTLTQFFLRSNAES